MKKQCAFCTILAAEFLRGSILHKILRFCFRTATIPHIFRIVSIIFDIVRPAFFDEKTPRKNICEFFGGSLKMPAPPDIIINRTSVRFLTVSAPLTADMPRERQMFRPKRDQLTRRRRDRPPHRSVSDGRVGGDAALRKKSFRFPSPEAGQIGFAAAPDNTDSLPRNIINPI